MEGRTHHGPATLTLKNAVLGCLRAAGFSVEMTVHASSVQDAYIYGFAPQGRHISSDSATELAFGLDLILEGLDRLRNA